MYSLQINNQTVFTSTSPHYSEALMEMRAELEGHCRNYTNVELPQLINVQAAIYFGELFNEPPAPKKPYSNKITVIKLLRTLFGLGLYDAKQLAEFFATVEVEH
jgi:hypothetical protein